MASLEFIEPPTCTESNCGARATRRLKDQAGMTVADLCARHANAALVELAKREGGRPTIKVAKPIESGRAK